MTFKPDEIFTEDPFAAVDQETMARMATLRGQSPSTEPESHPAVLEIESLREALQRANDAKDQAIAQVAILKSKAMKDGSHPNPDGSLTVTAIIDADTVLALEPWIELEGTSVTEVAQKYIPIALSSYINGA